MWFGQNEQSSMIYNQFRVYKLCTSIQMLNNQIIPCLLFTIQMLNVQNMLHPIFVLFVCHHIQMVIRVRDQSIRATDRRRSTLLALQSKSYLTTRTFCSSKNQLSQKLCLRLKSQALGSWIRALHIRRVLRLFCTQTAALSTKDRQQKDVYDTNMIRPADTNSLECQLMSVMARLIRIISPPQSKVTQGLPKSLYTAVTYAFSYTPIYSAPTCGLDPHKHSWYDDECRNAMRQLQEKVTLGIGTNR